MKKNIYDHSLANIDLNRAVVNLSVRYGGRLVLVDHLESLPRNSVDRLTDRLDMTLIVLIGP